MTIAIDQCGGKRCKKKCNLIGLDAKIIKDFVQVWLNSWCAGHNFFVRILFNFKFEGNICCDVSYYLSQLVFIWVNKKNWQKTKNYHYLSCSIVRFFLSWVVYDVTKNTYFQPPVIGETNRLFSKAAKRWRWERLM